MLIIYIGAIAILFLFVIMMLNIKTVELSFFYNKKNIPLGILLGILFLLELVVIIFNFYNSNSLTFYKHEGSIVLINYL
jgi:NADH:ubiquinone oxidoreductase subunit 6 (subunit J)